MKTKLIIPIALLVIILGGVGFWVLQQQPAEEISEVVSTTPALVETIDEAGAMQIASSAFLPNEIIPTKYTCDGEDISPPLAFTDVPEETKSLSLIVDDSDAPAGTWVHWVAWNIDPTTEALEEGRLPAGTEEGINDFGKTGYGGPCPSSGTHRYFFKLYALDTAFDLPASTDKEALLAAIEGHILAQAELVGRYSR